jgi:ketosteroid isomerase-like protein
MTETSEDLVEHYWRATCARDWPALDHLLDEQVLYEIPPTRARMRGRADVVEFIATCAASGEVNIESIVASDKQAVSRVALDVDGEMLTGITFFEFRQGLISRITNYWQEPCCSADTASRIMRRAECY